MSPEIAYEETDQTPRERLADIKVRIMSAQDAVGWADQREGEAFHEAVASSVVEYGRCLRDLAALVQTLLPED